MKKIIFLLLLLPFVGFSQTVDLVKWVGTTDLRPTLLNDYISAENFSGSGITGPSASYDGITGTNWPTGNARNNSRYFQIAVNQTLDGSFNLEQINFNYKGNSRAYEVRYSMNANFTNSVSIGINNSANFNNNSISGNLTGLNIPVTGGQTIYIRFYAYNGGGNWKVMNNITLRGTVTAPNRLMGDYIVGSASGAKFNTLTAAVKALNALGVRGATNLILDNTTYNRASNEIFPIVFNDYTGNETYPVTVKPNTGKTVTIEASNDGWNIIPAAVFKINGTDNVIFDGSNNGTTSKNLTIYNNNTVNPKRSVIWVASENGSNGANNNIFKNIILRQYTTESSPAYGIYSGGTGSLDDASSAANSSNTVQNVTFTKVGQPVYVNSGNIASSNWKIIGNTIGGNADDNKALVGIYLNNASNYEITENSIVGILKNNTSTASPHSGIMIEGTSNGTISKNLISDVSNTTSNNYHCAGIYLNSSNNLVTNNYVTNIKGNRTGDNASNFFYAGQGIYVKSGNNNRIYFNTVLMNSTGNNNIASAALYIEAGTNITVRNNIFYNQQSGRQYAINCGVANSQITSDYNNLKSSTVGYYNNANRTSIQNWKDAIGRDSNSLDLTPVFNGLRLEATNTVNQSLIGQQVSPAITTDYYSQTRTAPVMGAEEITTCAPAGDQTTSGTNNWIGYVYNNASDTANPPANPFNTANYKGYITIGTDVFDNDLDTNSISGPNLCGTYADNFAVRYKMRRNFPAGTYTFTVGGDDGYRLKIGGVTVIDNFTVHSYETTTSAPITLSGNTNLILEYYEDLIHSRVSFSYTYTPCATLSAPTSIAQSVATTTCVTGDSVVLTAQGGTPAGTIYQWGTGTVSTANAIAGETGASITVSPNTTTTYWVRRFSNDACNTFSSAITSTVTPTDRTAYGVGEWIGYVYSNYTNYATTPATENSNYRGYVTEPIIFERNIASGSPFRGENTYLCNAPVTQYFVRYKMKMTLAAGTYNFTVGGDDGYRLKIDGVAIAAINSWNEHGYATSSVTSIMTTGEHTFEIEYFNGPSVARVSFTYNKREGDPTAFGEGVWNVYGYNAEDINVDPSSASYYGWFVDPSLGINSEDRWNKALSPSTAVATATAGTTAWAGATLPNNNFTVIHKRKGFPCGLYQIKMDKWDDAVQVYLDGNLIFEATGYNGNANTIVHPELAGYYLNADSRMEVRLREGGGDAYVKMTLTDKPSIFNGTWSTAPENTSIRIDSDFALNSNLNVCSCTVKAGKKLTIEPNAALNVMENVVVEATGTILVKNTGSLVQIKDNATFTGNADSFTMERNTTPMIIYDFTYWSSPVASQKLVTFSPLTLSDKYYSYNGTGWFIENRDNTMTPGRGYIIRAPQGWNGNITHGGTSQNETHANGSFDPGVFKGVFKGRANAGDITVPLLGSTGSTNLLGNPYPSPISTTDFIAQNPGKIDGTFYFWTHKTRVSSVPNANGTYSYNNQDYAVYNKTGGIATSPIDAKPNGNINSGQGFFVRTIGTGNIVFKNSMRIKGIGQNSNFHRTGNTNQRNAESDSKYWLSLANADGLYSESLVGYIDGATDNLDTDFDGITYSSGNVILYTVVNANKLAIQGRQYPFNNTDAVPVGYKVATAGQYTISINKKEGLFENGQEIYLYDTTTNQYHDLNAGDFTFTSVAGTFENRFEVRYVNESLGVDTPIASNSDIVVYKNGNQIAAKATNFTIIDLQVYDITGKLLFNKKGIDSNEFSTSSLNVATQVVVVKVTLDGGQTISKKVIMN